MTTGRRNGTCRSSGTRLSIWGGALYLSYERARPDRGRKVFGARSKSLAKKGKTSPRRTGIENACRRRFL